jgi:hypothetical protein
VRRPTATVAPPQQPTEIKDMPWIFFKRVYQPQRLDRIIACKRNRGGDNRGGVMGRVFVSSIVSAALMVGTAQAADMPVKAPVYKAPVAETLSWTGFYVGGNVGYGWGYADPTSAAHLYT